MTAKKRPCSVCGMDLNLWGPDCRGTCPSCLRARRDSVVLCAGKCGRSYALRLMEKIIIYFDPAQKGGKKIPIYYCPGCAVAVKSRCRSVHDVQQEVVKKSENRVKRVSRLRKK